MNLPNRHSLSTKTVSGTILGTEGISKNKTGSALKEALEYGLLKNNREYTNDCVFLITV
jgi:hypothetical protein